jgi:hypothetical protein
MRKIWILIFIIVLVVGALSTSVQAADKRLAIGTKLLYVLPGLSSQLWFDNDIGIEGNIWPYAPLWFIIEGNILYKKELRGLKPVISLGFNYVTGGVEEARGSESAINLGLGLNYGSKEFSFIPALGCWISSGKIINFISFSFHWFR